MNIDFTCKFEDGESFEVNATSRDILVWEKTSRDKNAAFLNLLTNLRMTELYRLAYIAAKRQGTWNSDLQDFEQRIELEFDTDQLYSEREADPTQPVP